MNEKNNRVLYFDILNIIAIISVIALHCNGIVHGSPNSRAWATSLIVECLFYFAVPLFIMLSGANLLNYRDKYDTKTFFKKRFIKVLIPFVFWAIIMFIWKIGINQLELDYNFKKIINAFFTNKEESTYYFMWVILGLYLTIPFISLTAKKENKKTLFLTVVLYFIFNSFLGTLLPFLGISFNLELTVKLGGYVIYLILGYLLSTFDINKKYRIVIHILAIIGLFYRYFTTYYYSKTLGYVFKDTWGYTSWHCILLSMSVFLIIKYSNLNSIENNNKLSNIVKEISSCSFGIYLIHLIVKYYEIGLFNWNTYSWHFRTFGVIVTYIVSLAIVYILKRIPVIKKTVP